jgi:RNA ligase (TIGR02306 family)
LGIASVAEIPLNTDLSEALGITKYEPPIPMHMAGEVTPVTVAQWRQHDVEPMGIYAEEFQEGEPVVVTEKIHGSQVVIYAGSDGTEIITSKGLSAKGLALKASDTNVYWRAVRNEVLFERFRHLFPGCDVQAFGEVVPVQKGFGYGAEAPTVRLFRLLVEGRELSQAEVPEGLRAVWVPTLFVGPFNRAEITRLAQGKEQVSGHEWHIREGVVVSPAIPRPASRGFALYLKVINPKFKDSEEFVS